jgi:hypothetical protein
VDLKNTLLEIFHCVNGTYSWTPVQIKQRGLKLLEFMEKRGAIKLGDEAAKVELLGIRDPKTI